MKGLRAKVPETSLKYGEYDISFLPEDARPDQSKNNLGKHSYTLRSSGGCLEVLLQKEAFFVKSVGPSGTGPKGQVSWKKMMVPTMPGVLQSDTLVLPLL